MNQRNGTDVDAANAMKVFSKLGYKVKVYNDQTVEQMKQILISGTFCCRIRTKHDWWKDLFSDCLVPKKYYIVSFVFLFVCFFSIKGWSQELRLIHLRSVESRRWGNILWYRRLSGAQYPHVTFSRQSMQITGGEAQAVLHPGLFVCLFQFYPHRVWLCFFTAMLCATCSLPFVMSQTRGKLLLQLLIIVWRSDAFADLLNKKEIRDNGFDTGRATLCRHAEALIWIVAWKWTAKTVNPPRSLWKPTSFTPSPLHQVNMQK